MEAWQASLIGSKAGRWTIQAIQPCLSEWADRRGRGIGFHLTQECEAWEGERRALTAVVGEDLSLPALMRAMLEVEDKWKAVSSFCNSVMSQKEEAERRRRGEAAEDLEAECAKDEEEYDFENEFDYSSEIETVEN
ncbi:uncharacterized protein [Linepithema humile]|uniref:uncharacterized protein n=1 Tax=Linepithema humile TaxID=83485 RepID=UPI00351F2FCD